MIHELREYTTLPGRMPALVRRFTEHTFRIFARHGMDLVCISLTAVGENSTNELVYVLRFADFGDMERRWAAFQADPEWQQVKADSERDGPIVLRVARRVLDPEPFVPGVPA